MSDHRAQVQWKAAVSVRVFRAAEQRWYRAGLFGRLVREGGLEDRILRVVERAYQFGKGRK